MRSSQKVLPYNPGASLESQPDGRQTDLLEKLSPDLKLSYFSEALAIPLSLLMTPI
jgi:hypothetical protein